MIHSFILFIEKIVIPFGAFGVFFAEVIEEIIVPIPSAIVLFASGFILLKGDTSIYLIRDLIFTISIPGALGLTLGSTFIYALGYYGGKPFIDKYGKYIDVSWDEVLKFDERMTKTRYDDVLFVVARIIPLVPSSLIAIFSGVTRMPLKNYLILTFIGSFFKALIYAFVGHKVGELYYVYADAISKVEKVGLLFIVLVIGSVFAYRGYKKYKK